MRIILVIAIVVLTVVGAGFAYFLFQEQRPTSPSVEPTASSAEAPIVPKPDESASPGNAAPAVASENTVEMSVETEQGDTDDDYVTVSGTVTDAATGATVAGAMIFGDSYHELQELRFKPEFLASDELQEANLSRDELIDMLDNRKPLSPVIQKALDVSQVVTDDAGAFSFNVDSSYDESLYCRADGYALVMRDIEESNKESVRIDFQLRPEATVSGKVTDAASGEGVANVTVVAMPGEAAAGPIWSMEHQTSMTQARTGKDGAYRIMGMQAGRYQISVQGAQSGWLFDMKRALNVNVAEGENTTDANFEVTAGLTIAGVVSNEEGNPIEQAFVSVQLLDPISIVSGDISAQDMNFVPLYTDEDGHYEFPAARAAIQYSVSVRHDDYAPASSPVSVASGESGAELNFTLVVGAPVAGTAKYEDGSLATDETLELFRAKSGEEPFGRPGDSTPIFTDDATAVFRIEHVAAGEYRVAGGAHRYSDENAGVKITTDGKTPVEGLVVTVAKDDGEPPDAILSGTVLTPDGKSAAGVEVAVESDEADMFAAMSRQSATTDEQGNFTIERVPENRFAVVATSETEEARQENVVAGDTVTLRLGPMTTVSVEVVTDAGDPVAGCTVTLAAPPSDKGESMQEMMSKMMGSMMGGAESTNSTDDFGRFTFKHVEPGAHVVQAKLAGKGHGASETITATQGKETNVRVVLEAGVVFSGITVDGSGTPVQGVNVSLVESKGGPMESFMMNLPMGMGAKPEAAASSGADGTFAMEGLKKGSYLISAKHADFAPYVAKGIDVSGAQSSPYRIQLGKGGSAKGQYVVDGKPRANVMIQLTGANGTQMATTDSEGRFEVKGIAAGTYMLIPIDMGAAQRGGDMMSNFKMKSVTITEGGEVEIAFGAGVDVTGTVPSHLLDKMTIVYLMRPGAPDLGSFSPGGINLEANFEQMQNIAGFAMVGDDGAFTIGSVDPGEYELRVYGSDFSMDDVNPQEWMNMSMEEMQAQSERFKPRELTRQSVSVGGEPMTITLEAPAEAPASPQE